MGVISSAGKALGRKVAKKSAAKTAGKTAAKKAPKASRTLSKEDMVVGGLLATPVVTLPAQYALDEMKRADKRAKEARARLPQGADKFGWAGRR